MMRFFSRYAVTSSRVVASLLLMMVSWSAAAQSQPAGQVEFSRGAGYAQQPGQAPRVLGKGLKLQEGDRLTTAEGSTAIVVMADGTRMTLRPNSDLVVQRFQFTDRNATDNSMVMQLLRGGLRAVTGLISKNSPDAARIQTSTATIGIRGTDFDARICNVDCRGEAAKVKEAPRVNAVIASAKLVSSRGEVFATDIKGVRRRVVDGGSVYPGDVVETATGAQGVLIFRDESRLSLGAATVFRVDAFNFDAGNPADGKFLISLVRGTMRALTGLIGKTNSRNVGFVTSTATIGIRGTGLDLDCGSGAGCSFFTWLGTIEVTPEGQTALQVLQAGQGLFVSREGIRPLTAPTLEGLPRPDSVPVNVQQLFSSGGVNSDEEGLYVYVRDGHIEVSSSSETLHLGRGETGFAAPDGQTGRPVSMPLFIQFDQVPMPNSSNPQLLNLLNDLGLVKAQVCR